MGRNGKIMKLVNICNNCQMLGTKEGYVIFDYGTPVFAIDFMGDFYRLWSGWSITTQRHINKALATLGRNGISKADWYDMPVERVEV